MKRITGITVGGILLAILAASTPSVHGQSTGSSVQGTITDSTSALIPGVRVTVTNRDTNASASTISDGKGKYMISGLVEGNYRIAASLPGFNTNNFDKTITKDSSLQQDFVLTIDKAKKPTIVIPIGDRPSSEGMVIHPQGNYR